jgi:hypothetical protein
MINKHMRVRYTIIDGEHEYGDSFTFRSDGIQNEECAYRELAEFYACDDEEAQEILQTLQKEGTAMIGCRAIKDIRVEDVIPITITVRGGVIQDISNIPPDVTVHVRDYDVENLTEQERRVKTEKDIQS